MGAEALSSMFESERARSAITLYVADDGSRRAFILDRSRPGIVLMQFRGDPEVWVLSSTVGARGDEFLRNDAGEVMVRITSLGGATLYPQADDAGVAVAPEGDGQAISGMIMASRSLQGAVEGALPQFERLSPASLRLEAAGGLPPALVHDALGRAAHAMSLALAGSAPDRARGIRRIRVERAARPYARVVEASLLEIGVTPGTGFAGRPSSAAVRAALRAD